jgi:hypothetical protein
VQDLLAWMRECAAVRRIEGAGSWRRGRETVGDIDLVAEAADGRVEIEFAPPRIDPDRPARQWPETGANPETSVTTRAKYFIIKRKVP